MDTTDEALLKSTEDYLFRTFPKLSGERAEGSGDVASTEGSMGAEGGTRVADVVNVVCDEDSAGCTEGTESANSDEDVGSAEGTESANSDEDVGSAEGDESAEGAGSAEGDESAEDAGSAEGAENAGGVERVEGVENVGDAGAAPGSTAGHGSLLDLVDANKKEFQLIHDMARAIGFPAVRVILEQLLAASALKGSERGRAAKQIHKITKTVGSGCLRVDFYNTVTASPAVAYLHVGACPRDHNLGQQLDRLKSVCAEEMWGAILKHLSCLVSFVAAAYASVADENQQLIKSLVAGQHAEHFGKLLVDKSNTTLYLIEELPQRVGIFVSFEQDGIRASAKGGQRSDSKKPAPRRTSASSRSVLLKLRKKAAAHRADGGADGGAEGDAENGADGGAEGDAEGDAEDDADGGAEGDAEDAGQHDG